MKFTLRTYLGNASDVLTEDGTVVAQFPPNSGGIRGKAQSLMFKAPEVVAERDRLLADNRKLREALEDIGEYKGEGGPSTPWREIVRSIGEKARSALEVSTAKTSRRSFNDVGSPLLPANPTIKEVCQFLRDRAGWEKLQPYGRDMDAREWAATVLECAADRLDNA